MINKSHCTALDEADPLGPLRDQFDLPDGVVYLDGNSLGALPRASAARAQEVIRAQWGNDLIRSWNKAGWFDLPIRLGNKIAPLIGAGQDEVAVTDSTSINLFKVLAAALTLQAANPATAHRRVIITERDNFPSDIYIAEGLTKWLDRGYRLQLLDNADQLPAALDDNTAVVMLTHVNYRSGRLFDMAAVTSQIHDCGALAVWDLAHSAGAVPIDLHAAQADFAIGCTYKYLNGGPGSPAFVWVAPRHYASLSQPLSGWWAHATPFSMAPSFSNGIGIRRMLCGTQPVVSLAMVECGLDVFALTDMAAIRKKSLALTDLFIALVRQECAGFPLALATPEAHAERGSHVSFTHPEGYAVMQALIERGVIGDYREPQIMRFGFTPLYTDYSDVWQAVAVLKDILETEAYDTAAERFAVT